MAGICTRWRDLATPAVSAVTDAAIGEAIQDLLRRRAADATICPSEVARTLAPEGWRALMPQVRAVAVELARHGQLEIRQGGHTISPAAAFRGPIRLGHRREVSSC